MKLVRYFVLVCLRDNVAIKAKHIPGVQNNIADALSRSQMARFRHLAPSAAQSGLKVYRATCAERVSTEHKNSR